ncbi:MAG: tetratricopeptide repeat protein [Limnothrix sp.]
MKLRHKLLGMGLGVAVLCGKPTLIQSPKIIAQTEQSIKQQAWQLLGQGAYQLKVRNFREALVSWKKSSELYRQIGDLRGEANALSFLGLTYLSLSEYEQALSFYQQSLELYRQISNRPGEAKSLNNLGIAYESLGEYRRAITAQQQSLEISREIGDRQGEANSLANLGNTYLYLGDYQQAITFQQQSLEIDREIDNRQGEARSLGGLGNIHNSLGNYQQAITFYRQFLDITREIGDRHGEASSLGGLGNAYLHLGEYQQALSFYQRWLEIAREIGDRQGEAGSLGNLGFVYFSLGDYQQAIIFQQQSLEIVRKIGDRQGEGTIVNGLAITYQNLGDYQRAIAFHQQSLKIAQEIGNRDGESASLSNLGIAYESLGDYQRAIAFQQQSLKIAREIGDLEGEAISLNNLGLAYLNLGDYQQAIVFCQQSLDIARQIGSSQGQAISLNNLGLTQQKLQQYEKAIVSFQQAIEILEATRSQITSIELRQIYFATVQETYQHHIDALMALHQQESTKGYDQQAFNTSEKSRARILVELLTESSIDPNIDLPPALRQQQIDITQKLNQTEQQRITIFSNPASTDTEKQTINQTLDQVIADFRTLENDIRRSNPAYADLKYPETISVAELQNQILDEDTVLLQYFLGDEKSYLWAVTKESFHSYELPSEADITQTAKALFGEPLTSPKATNPVLAASLQQQRLDLTRQLSEQIIQPAAAQLTKKRILIVPDGELNYFPFSILTTGAAETKTLSEQFELVHLPSSSTLATIRTETVRPIPDRPSLSIFADPVFSTKDCRFTNSPNCDQDRLVASRSRASSSDYLTWDDLPGTYTEANNILKLFPDKSKTKAAFGFAAQREKIVDDQLQGKDIIHFATHGFFHQTKPEQSGLVFSLVDEAGDRQNGFLRLDSIFNMQLDADLVVLSACQTGVGEDVPGEGIVGLSRGFMYAGTPRLLMSLWQVDDKATAEFMTRFYKNLLEEKQTTAIALKETQREMREETEWTHPQYWAAFILQGDWN